MPLLGNLGKKDEVHSNRDESLGNSSTISDEDQNTCSTFQCLFKWYTVEINTDSYIVGSSPCPSDY